MATGLFGASRLVTLTAIWFSIGFKIIKKIISLAAAVAIAVISPLNAYGSIVFKDGFEAPVHNVGQLNDNNWTGWTGANVTTGGLSANGINGGGQKLTFNGNNASAASHSLGPNSSSSPLYVSFLLNIQIATLQDNDFFSLWLGNSDGPNIGLKANLGPNDSDYFVRFSLGGEEYASLTQAQANTTVQLVGRLSNDGIGSGYNVFDLWVNPNFNDLSNPDATATVANGLNSFSQVGMRTANLNTNDRIHFDELNVATEWGDVVTPEPMSLLVWGGLALAAGVAIRKRS
jgi:hypothetical protein